MGIRLLNKYMQLCAEFHCTPSLEGLKLFKMSFIGRWYKIWQKKDFLI